MTDFLMNQAEHVREQYRDPGNLGARSALHERFSTNTYGWHRWVFERLDLFEGASVLEVGCGPGSVWVTREDRVPAGCRVVLADLSEGMASAARSALGQQPFGVIVADAQFLPFPDSSFDRLVANHMLYHVPDIALAVAEFARVLRSDGRLLAATNGRRHMTQLRLLMTDNAFRVSPFSLEDGEVLSGRFSDIVVERYSDSLEVTEVEPLMAYVRSMEGVWLSDRTEDEARALIAATIERDGAFRIEKDAGLVTAVRP